MFDVLRILPSQFFVVRIVSSQDGNIPSGEAFVRQFLIGQRFFKREFGHYCKEVCIRTYVWVDGWV